MYITSTVVVPLAKCHPLNSMYIILHKYTSIHLEVLNKTWNINTQQLHDEEGIVVVA